MNDRQSDWLKQRFTFTHAERLPVFGSQREFYRLKGEGESRIVIIDPDIAQIQAFVNKAVLFGRSSVDVPVIFDYSVNLNIILEEDLGDISLDKLVNGNNDRLALYKQVIDLMVSWQKKFDELSESGNDFELPEYDIEFAFNESMLFVRRYLNKYLHKACIIGPRFKQHFVDLADRASSIRKTLMHRDFQSQNILWRDGKPYFVDFQTAMFGPYTYDAASLIYDNYVDLDRAEQETLIDYFFSYYPESNREDFYAAALQRTLQAISAYAYLSVEQEKRQYEQFIPRGLEHLRQLSDRFDWVRDLIEQMENTVVCGIR